MSIGRALMHEMFRLSRKYLPGRTYRLRDRLFRAFNVRIRGAVPIDGIYFQIDTHNYHERGIFCFGKYEIGTSNYIARFVAHMPAGVVIDIGANIGLHTLGMAAARSSRDVLVLAFEANPDMVAKLRRNLALNGFSNVRVYPFGLNDRDSVVDLGLPYAEGQDTYHNPGIASMTNWDRAVRRIAVTCRTLDNVMTEEKIGWGDVRLMKIDVEGKELDVLRGADKVLSQSGPAIIVEYNKGLFADIQALLTGYGYSRIGSLVRYGVDNDTLEENVLFLKIPA
jgi:FkbM family methyltransferase